ASDIMDFQIVVFEGRGLTTELIANSIFELAAKDTAQSVLVEIEVQTISPVYIGNGYEVIGCGARTKRVFDGRDFVFHVQSRNHARFDASTVFCDEFFGKLERSISLDCAAFVSNGLGELSPKSVVDIEKKIYRAVLVLSEHFAR